MFWQGSSAANLGVAKNYLRIVRQPFEVAKGTFMHYPNIIATAVCCAGQPQ
jgi:hypothetical protein